MSENELLDVIENQRAELERIVALLARFQDIMSENSFGRLTNHHNPIWVEVADTIAAYNTPELPVQ